MLMFPASMVKSFEESEWYAAFKAGNGTRLGQAFHCFAKLHRVENPKDKEFCDKLWDADNEKAADLIVARIDENN